jgi:hypothetical protein
VVRGVATDSSGHPVRATLHDIHGGPSVLTDSLGEFRYVFPSRDSVRVRVDADGYLPQVIVIYPGRDSLLRVVFGERIQLSSLTIGDIQPRLFDRAAVHDGLAMVVQALYPGSQSVLLTLTSRSAFPCAPVLAVAEARDSSKVFLYVTYVATKHPCSGATDRAAWRTSFPAAPGETQIVVVINGVVDRFQLRVANKRLCVAGETRPNATRLIAGPYPKANSAERQDRASLEMLLFPEERLPAC